MASGSKYTNMNPYSGAFGLINCTIEGANSRFLFYILNMATSGYYSGDNGTTTFYDNSSVVDPLSMDLYTITDVVN